MHTYSTGSDRYLSFDRVICRSVGLFPVRVLSSETDREPFRSADLESVRFIGKNLVCDGDEENILQCSMDKVTGLECTADQIVSIECTSDEGTLSYLLFDRHFI